MIDIMKGKKGIVFGVANDRSMAWGIAKALSDAGAEIAFNYSGETMEKRVRPLAESVNSPVIMPVNVQDDASLDAFFAAVEKKIGKIDFLLHAVAFSNRDELTGLYVENTTRENFKNTMDISVYSFTDLCRRASKFMNEGGSCVTLTYLGGEVYIPNYNVMGVAKAALDASVKYLASDLGKKGIRVNGISAGPIKTLAASGIDAFSLMQKWNAYNTFLSRNMTLEDVSKTGLYLLSDLSSGVSGEILYCDCGYHNQGMVNLSNIRLSGELLTSYADKHENK